MDENEEFKKHRDANRMWLMGLAGILILVSGSFILLSEFGQKPSTQEDDAQMDESQSVSQRVQSGEEVELELGDVSILIPAGALDKSEEITISMIDSDIPAAEDDTELASNVYEFGPEGAEFDEDSPAVITMSYDDSGLSEEEIETLFIAYWDDDSWIPLEGNLIDRDNQVISVTTTHFSWYAVFNYIEEAIKELDEAVFQDVIEARISFYDLPEDLQITLKKEYSPDTIKSALYWKVSHASKAASTTIAAAQMISQLSGLVLAAVEGGEEALGYAVEEALVLALGQAAVTAASDEEIGTLTVALYDSANLGSALAEKGFKAVKGSATLQAEIGAWVLAREMEYIDANLDAGLKELWKLNLTSIERVEVYLIMIDGENKDTGLHDRGAQYYYFYPSLDKYVLYAQNLVSRELDIVLDESLRGETIEATVAAGMIEGSLSYPASGIPADLKVCARNLASNQQICTSDHVQGSNYLYGLGYELEVEPGDYYVYATVPSLDNYKAYYNKFVTCGLSIDCPDHTPIKVTVKSGQKTSDIDPGDWYAQDDDVGAGLGASNGPVTITSDTSAIAAFAENWYWSKQKDQDGKYGETYVELDMDGRDVSSATLHIMASYSQQSGSADVVVYIAAKQQVEPTDPAHDRQIYWYGDERSGGQKAGEFSCVYGDSTGHTFEVTDLVARNSDKDKFYIIVENKAAADIGVSGIYLEAEVR